MRRPKRGTRREPPRDETRVNERIRVPRVLVVDENGNKLGEFLTPDALSIARERGYDLVEVAPNARPPVCRFADYGKMKYDKKKRESQARRRQSTSSLKEIKLRPKTDQHDFDVKVRHARRFLEEGDKLKVTLRFRGREHAHRHIGEQQCRRVAEAVADLAKVVQEPRMEGRQMIMLMEPTKRRSSDG